MTHWRQNSEKMDKYDPPTRRSGHVLSSHLTSQKHSNIPRLMIDRQQDRRRAFLFLFVFVLKDFIFLCAFVNSPPASVFC